MATGSAFPTLNSLDPIIDAEVSVAVPPGALQLLRTNAHPQPAQTDVLHLSRLVMSQYLAELERQASKVRETLITIDGICAPVRLLPDELLAEIFLHANNSNKWNPLNGSALSWVLGRVCARWRQVALSLIDLWDSLGVRLRGDRWEEKHTEMLRECFRRSATAGFVSVTYVSGHNGEGEIAMLDLLTEHSSQLATLGLFLNPDPRSAEAFVRLGKRLSGVRSIQLSFGHAPPHDFPIFALFNSAQKLVSVELCSHSTQRLIPSHPNPMFPLHNLQRLHCIGGSSLLRILSTAPNLVECSLLTGRSPDPNLSTLTHSNLQNLTCCGDDLPGLTIPTLVELTVSLWGGDDFLTLTAFLNRHAYNLCNWHLHKLDVRGFMSPEQARLLHRVLVGVPTLAVLEFSECRASNTERDWYLGIADFNLNVVEPSTFELDGSTNNPGLEIAGEALVLPNLTTLAFSCKTSSALEELTPCVEVLEDRFRRGNTKLRFLELTFRSRTTIVLGVVPKALSERFEMIGIEVVVKIPGDYPLY